MEKIVDQHPVRVEIDAKLGALFSLATNSTENCEQHVNNFFIKPLELDCGFL